MLGNASFYLGLTLGLAAAFGAWGAVRLWFNVRGGRHDRGSPRSATEAFPDSSAPGGTSGPPVVRLVPGARPTYPREPRSATDSYQTSARTLFPDPVQLSYRVVLYLSRLPPVQLDELPDVSRTQQGMTEDLACPQSSLSEVLKRLVASGVVRQERQHVRGVDRRVLAYALTQRGERLARELAGPGAPRPSAVWEPKP